MEQGPTMTISRSSPPASTSRISSRARPTRRDPASSSGSSSSRMAGGRSGRMLSTWRSLVFITARDDRTWFFVCRRSFQGDPCRLAQRQERAAPGIDRRASVDLAAFASSRPAHADAALACARALVDPRRKPPEQRHALPFVEAVHPEPRGAIERGPEDLRPHLAVFASERRIGEERRGGDFSSLDRPGKDAQAVGFAALGAADEAGREGVLLDPRVLAGGFL